MRCGDVGKDRRRWLFGLTGRSLVAVVADMVDGVVAANGLAGFRAARERARLLAVLDDLLERKPSA